MVKPSVEWDKEHFNYKSDYKPCGTKFNGKPSAREIYNSEEFKNACARLEVKPSVRQARDFRRKIGRFAV